MSSAYTVFTKIVTDVVTRYSSRAREAVAAQKNLPELIAAKAELAKKLEIAKEDKKSWSDKLRTLEREKQEHKELYMAEKDTEFAYQQALAREISAQTKEQSLRKKDIQDTIDGLKRQLNVQIDITREIEKTKKSPETGQFMSDESVKERINATVKAAKEYNKKIDELQLQKKNRFGLSNMNVFALREELEKRQSINYEKRKDYEDSLTEVYGKQASEIARQVAISKANYESLVEENKQNEMQIRLQTKVAKQVGMTRYGLMSLYFALKQLSQVLMSMMNPAAAAVGIFEVFSAILEMAFLPFMLTILEPLLSLLDIISNMSESQLLFIGTFIASLYGLVTALSIGTEIVNLLTSFGLLKTATVAATGFAGPAVIEGAAIGGFLAGIGDTLAAILAFISSSPILAISGIIIVALALASINGLVVGIFQAFIDIAVFIIKGITDVLFTIGEIIVTLLGYQLVMAARELDAFNASFLGGGKTTNYEGAAIKVVAVGVEVLEIGKLAVMNTLDAVGNYMVDSLELAMRAGNALVTGFRDSMDFAVTHGGSVGAQLVGLVADVLDTTGNFGGKFSSAIKEGLESAIPKAKEISDRIAKVLSDSLEKTRIQVELLEMTMAKFSKVGQLALYNAASAMADSLKAMMGMPEATAWAIAKARFGLASGGIVTRPTIAMIGESGPEAVVPLNQTNGMGMGDTNYNTININANISSDYDVDRLTERIEQNMYSHYRRRSLA